MSQELFAVQSTALPDAVGILKADGQRVSEFFVQFLARHATAPRRLIESIEYSMMAGGKRLRPAMILETWRACGGQESSPSFASALSAATAMEMIHTFSLIHDDLPAMDNDDLRRGRPTNHKVYGEAMAILAGDAMTTMAFDLIATDAEPSKAIALIRELAHASGPEGMIGGQVLDIDGEKQTLSLPQLQQVHRMKTGALLTASCRLGAIAAGVDGSTLAAVTECGRHLGLAFQIVDDVLDVTSSPEMMGKATGKDHAKGKNTYPSLMGLERSKQEAHLHLELALKEVEPLGDATRGLVSLARFVVEREL
jgi:geranylgeranyl diphosphate synthase type II